MAEFTRNWRNELVGEIGEHRVSCSPTQQGHQWNWAPGTAATKRWAQSCLFGKFPEGNLEMSPEG